MDTRNEQFFRKDEAGLAKFNEVLRNPQFVVRGGPILHANVLHQSRLLSGLQLTLEQFKGLDFWHIGI